MQEKFTHTHTKKKTVISQNSETKVNEYILTQVLIYILYCTNMYLKLGYDADLGNEKTAHCLRSSVTNKDSPYNPNKTDYPYWIHQCN